MKRLILIAAIVTGFWASPVAASGLVVIANPDLPVSEISSDELRAVFLGAKTSLKYTGQVQPVLTKPGPALTEFAAEYLGKTESALLIYYRSLVFAGKWSMPVTLNSDAEVVAYVARTRGAIGFVRDGSNLQGVITVKVK